MSHRRWTRWRLIALTAGVVVLLIGCAYLLLVFGGGLGQSPRSASYRFIEAWTGAGGSAGGGFDDPFAITVDPRNSHVLVTDARNQRVVVLDADGKLLRAFGSQGDGPGRFERPTGIAIGPDGALYIADFDLDRIQKFTDRGEFLLQWGGSGTAIDQFQAPNGMAVDERGRIYIADFQNSIIKVFDAAGRFQRTIGRPGQLGPGRLDYPTDVALATVPGADTLLITDAYNHRIQRFTLTGEHRASWGRHLLWLIPRPAGGRAGFHVPTGVAFDPAHRLIHIADSGNHRIVMLDAAGRFITDWPLPDPGPRYSPTMVAASPDGRRLYATDTAGDRVIVLEVQVTSPE